MARSVADTNLVIDTNVSSTVGSATVANYPGVLYSVSINTTDAAGNNVTLYDNTSGTGTKLWEMALATNTNATQNWPNGIPFFTGLSVTGVAAQNLSVVLNFTSAPNLKATEQRSVL